MKHKLNVNGDIESRRRDCGSAGTFPSVKPYSKTIQPQHHETEENQAAAAEETVSPAAEAPKARRRKTAGDA